MLHSHRTFAITDSSCASQLAFDLTRQDWTLCTGFRLGDYLFLNDSITEASTQEYAIVHEATLVQVESITVSWMTWPDLTAFLEHLMAGTAVTFPVGKINAPQLVPAADHRPCYLCR